MSALLLHPEMGDNGSGPFIILYILLYVLCVLALAAGAAYLLRKLFKRLRRRR